MQEIIDNEGMLWIWDGKRVYLQEAEEEVGEENGYPASSYDKAIKVLIEGGYLGKRIACHNSIVIAPRLED